MAWKTFVKDYLTFSKKERLAALVVICFLVFAYSFPALFSDHTTAFTLQEDSLLAKAIDTLHTRSTQDNEEDKSTAPFPYYSAQKQVDSRGYTEGELFRFDPNTLPAEGWQRLGLNDRTIRLLINYRNKGGRFYKPEDLKKVWTMPVGFYERVQHLVSIKPPERTTYPVFTSTRYPREERKIQPLNINDADTAAFIALPGIGPVLAGRIINFRDKLGGFHSVDQLGETYGLPDSTFRKLKPYFTLDERSIRKIDLNTATKDDLNAHPYISWKLANAIVEYRNQRGEFQSIDDLKNIVILDDSTFLRIRVYLAIN